MELVDVVRTVKHQDRTEDQWRRIGRNHGDACIARMLRQEPLPRKLRVLFLECVIEGLSVEATRTSFSVENAYWTTFIDTLRFYQASASFRSAA